MSKQLVQTVIIATDKTKNKGYKVPEGFIGKLGIFFTQEEYNKHIKEIIEETLKNGAEGAKIDGYLDLSKEDKDSILNTFEETYLKYKL